MTSPATPGWRSFNLNEKVRVKLNQRGLAILKAKADELRASGPNTAARRT